MEDNKPQIKSMPNSNLSDLLSILPGTISITLNSGLNQMYEENKVKEEKITIDSKCGVSVNKIIGIKDESEDNQPCKVKIEVIDSLPGCKIIGMKDESEDSKPCQNKIEVIDSLPGCSTDHGIDKKNAVKKKKQHTCTHCYEKFSRKFELINHKINEHKDVIRLPKCIPCNAVLPTGRHFKRHFKICPYQYMQKQLFSCQKCNNKYVKNQFLNDHIRNYHQNEIEKRFTCSICGKSFKKQKILNFHISTHPELWQSCGVCKRPFRKQIDLKRHMITHSNKVPYFCEVCKIGFIEKNEFKKHKKQMHKKNKKNKVHHSYINQQ